MSQCLWCDFGNHPFPAGQPGSTNITLTEQVRNQWGGQQPHGIVKDVCAACAVDMGVSARKLTAREQEEDDYERAESVRTSTGGKLKRMIEKAE